MGDKDPRPISLDATISPEPLAARLRFVVRVNDTDRVSADNFLLVDPSALSLSTTGLVHAKHP